MMTDNGKKWWETMVSGRLCVRIAVGVGSALLLIAIFSSTRTQSPVQYGTNTAQPERSAHQNSKARLHKGPLPVPVDVHGVKVPAVPATELPDLVEYNMDDQGMVQTGLDRVVPVVANIPAIVHLVWCGQRFFEFKHYLSVKSITRLLRTDKMIIHYEVAPQIDQLFYHQWIEDIAHDFPFLHMEQIQPQDAEVCTSDSRDTRLSIIMRYLAGEGGFYVGENTWLLKLATENRMVDMFYSMNPTDQDGFMAVKPGIPSNVTYEGILADPLYNTKKAECTSLSQFYQGATDPDCLIVKGTGFDSFFPFQIWELDDDFGRLSRRIFYGNETIPKPVPSYDELVPNIGHMIWLGGGNMDFVFYLSALSMLYVMEVDTVYIHGDKEPAGEYWPLLKTNPRIQFVVRPQPTIIYQGPIEWYYRALMSDILRVDIMIKYGGIYCDTDAIWVKPLSKEDYGYEAVASYDWVDWSYPYPDSVNFGLSYGKRNAPFWRIFRDSMRKLHNDVHGFTGVMMPYKLLEKYPHLLRIDRRLAVICYKFRCHPTWVKNYHDENNDHVNSGTIPNWREDVHAFHWTHPNPPEYANKTALLAAEGMFAEIGKFVLGKAGLL